MPVTMVTWRLIISRIYGINEHVDVRTERERKKIGMISRMDDGIFVP